MKYYICGFQQSKLIETGLDIEDAFILSVIKDMYTSASMEALIIDDIRYVWINYTYLLSQIPIIGSKRNLMRRIEKYSSKLLLIRVLKHVRKGQKGNFSYITPTQKLDALADYDIVTESHNLMTESHKGYDEIAQGLCQNSIRVVTESHNKDTSIKDTSIKDTSIKDIGIKAAKAAIMPITTNTKKLTEKKKNYGEFENVKLTEEEYSKLIDRFGKSVTEDKIENISLYMSSKGDKYKSHYATILAWSKKDTKDNVKFNQMASIHSATKLTKADEEALDKLGW